MRIWGIVGWLSGFLALVMIIALYIWFPLNGQEIFFIIDEGKVIINVLPNILLFVGLICMGLFVKGVGSKERD